MTPNQITARPPDEYMLSEADYGNQIVVGLRWNQTTAHGLYRTRVILTRKQARKLGEALLSATTPARTGRSEE